MQTNRRGSPAIDHGEAGPSRHEHGVDFSFDAINGLDYDRRFMAELTWFEPLLGKSLRGAS
jgi:hypothetical protein